jgi:hypothetical protein
MLTSIAPVFFVALMKWLNNVSLASTKSYMLAICSTGAALDVISL